MKSLFKKSVALAAGAVILASTAASAVSLTDISGHWGESDINTLVEEKVISGYPENINVLQPNSIEDFEAAEASENVLWKYNGNSKNVIIPRSFKYIEGTAFANTEVENVVIPDTVEEILDAYPSGDTKIGAFEGGILKKIRIPDSVTKIGSRAFYNNTLEKIRLSDNLATVGDEAFSNNKLEIVKLPKIDKIGKYAFYNNNLKHVNIPDTVKNIESYAFSSNDLVVVDISDSVIKIGTKAFYDNNIQTLTLKNNLKTIELDAFLKNNLTEVKIPKTVDKVVVLEGTNLVDKVVEKNESGLELIKKSCFNENIGIDLSWLEKLCDAVELQEYLIIKYLKQFGELGSISVNAF